MRFVAASAGALAGGRIKTAVSGGRALFRRCPALCKAVHPVLCTLARQLQRAEWRLTRRRACKCRSPLRAYELVKLQVRTP